MQVAVILTVLTLNSQILCQFVGCCNSHGTIHFFIQQVSQQATTAAFNKIFPCGLPFLTLSSFAL